MTALYRMPWYLDLAHRSRGAGYAVHAAALSRLEESGAKVLPAAELHLAFGNLPAFLRRTVLTALIDLELWAKTDDGYEVREAPGDVRPQTRQAPPSTASKDPSAAARARKHRALKKSGVTSTRDGAPSERDADRDADRDASRPGPVTERDGGRDASRDGDANSTFSSLSSQKEEAIKHGEKEERGMQGGAVTRDAGRDATPPSQRDDDRDAPTVTEPVTEPVTATASRPVTEPPSSQTPLPGLDGATDSPPPAPAPKAKRQRAATPAMSSEVLEVFEHWRKTLAPRAALIRERIQVIEAAFERGLSLDDCKTAIDGLAKSEYHRRKGYNDLTLILRPTKTDLYLSWGRGEASPGDDGNSSRFAPIQPSKPAPFVRRYGEADPTELPENWNGDEWIGPPEHNPYLNDPTREVT